jgi:hypothetical protein
LNNFCSCALIPSYSHFATSMLIEPPTLSLKSPSPIFRQETFV